MPTYTRVDYLLDQTHRILKGLEKTMFNADDILDALTEAQKEVARRGLALREVHELTMAKGVASYTLKGLVKVTALFPPTRWTEPLRVVEADTIWGDALSRSLAGDYPLFARGYGEQIEFLPTPALSGEKVRVEFARWPHAVRLEAGADPEVSPSWDPTLKLGALAGLLGGEYESSFKRAVDVNAVELEKTLGSGVRQRDHFSRVLGF